VVCAVDLPRVPASLVIGLVRRWRRTAEPEERAVVARDDTRTQPLVGVYGTGLLAALTEWLDAREDRAVLAWIDALGERVQRLRPRDLDGAVGHGEPLLNINRPEELAEATRRSLPAPPIVAVAGWKDSGKTSAAAALVRSLRQRGFRVMALKHGHRFDLDREGTDSARLRGGGAERVLLAGPDGFGLLGGWPDAVARADGEGGIVHPGGATSDGGSRESAAVELAARYLAEADVVVAEGWKRAPLPAIEVAAPGREDDPPLWSPESPDRDRFVARVTPGGHPGDASDAEDPPVLDRDGQDLGDRLAALVESRVIPGWLP
jgi:molybdopterin-guanine dinucleotide biosynthesis protein B